MRWPQTRLEAQIIGSNARGRTCCQEDFPKHKNTTLTEILLYRRNPVRLVCSNIWDLQLCCTVGLDNLNICSLLCLAHTTNTCTGKSRTGAQAGKYYNCNKNIRAVLTASDQKSRKGGTSCCAKASGQGPKILKARQLYEVPAPVNILEHVLLPI